MCDPKMVKYRQSHDTSTSRLFQGINWEQILGSSRVRGARPNTSVGLRFVAQVIGMPGIRILTTVRTQYAIAQ